MPEFQEFLKQKVDELGNRRKLAQFVGLRESVVYAWFNGTIPTHHHMELVLRRFGMSMSVAENTATLPGQPPKTLREGSASNAVLELERNYLCAKARIVELERENADLRERLARVGDVISPALARNKPEPTPPRSKLLRQ